MNTQNPKLSIRKITQTGLFAGLSFVGFYFLHISIPVGPAFTFFHLGNVFCVIGALLLGAPYGGLAGAIGMTIADLISGYAAEAPATFVLKLGIGLIVAFVAHNIGHLHQRTEKKTIIKWIILASSAGMIFNLIFDPLFRFLVNHYLFQLPVDLASTLAKLSALTTFVNALLAIFLSTITYLALFPLLKKNNLIDLIIKK